MKCQKAEVSQEKEAVLIIKDDWIMTVLALSHFITQKTPYEQCREKNVNWNEKEAYLDICIGCFILSCETYHNC